MKSVNLDSGLEWWWPGVASPMLLWVLASLAWAALVALLLAAWPRIPSVVPVLAPARR